MANPGNRPKKPSPFNFKANGKNPVRNILDFVSQTMSPFRAKFPGLSKVFDNLGGKRNTSEPPAEE